MESDEAAAERPDRDELIRDAQPVEPPGGPSTADLESGRERARIQTAGLRQFYYLRVMWSRWIIGWISALIAFQVVLTTAVGVEALTFPKHETFLNVVLGTNFLQVVALATIVVKFLHSDKPTESDDLPPI